MPRSITTSELHIGNSATARAGLATMQPAPLMWNYVIGPILALLPKSWRDSLPFASDVQWGRATVVSGLGESLGALIGLGYWYMHAMTTWVDRSVSAALEGKLGAEASVQGIAGVALTVWATHPLTLLLGYCIFEGTVRLCAAAFSEQNLGTFPLALLDWIFVRRFRRRNPAGAMEMGSAASNARSLVDAVRERMLIARGAEEQDELRFRNEAGEELMEIHASRRKQDWIPPRVVRYEDAYYRLEASAVKTGPRPFFYTLRKLPAGVPGRSVLIYSPTEALVRK
jgi:hypothetical protein